MDKRQILDDLKTRYDNIEKAYKLLEDNISKFEETPEFDAYSSYTQDAVKEETFPKQHEWYKARAGLEEKKEAFEKELVNAARNLYQEQQEKIESVEKKLQVNKKYVEDLESKIEALQQKIEDLKQTEEYKNGDEAIRLQVEELEEELNTKVARKEKIAKDITTFEAEIEQVQKEQEKLVADYGEEIKVAAETPDNDKPEEKQKEEENKEKGSKGGKNGNSNFVPDEKPELTEEEKAKIEAEEKEQKLKADYTELSQKIKKGNLTDKDFDRLAEIMKDPENYDKLGITTGLVFNKSRKIFKALENSMPNTKALSSEIKGKFGEELGEVDDATALSKVVELDRETLTEEQQALWDKAQTTLNKQAALTEARKSYQEVFFKRNDEKKLNWASKFFVIDEVENRDVTPALPESKSTKIDSGIPGLSEQVNTGELNEIPPKAQSIDVQEQTK